MDLRAIFGAEDAGIQMYFKDDKTNGAVNTLFARVQIRAIWLNNYRRNSMNKKECEEQNESAVQTTPPADLQKPTEGRDAAEATIKKARRRRIRTDVLIALVLVLIIVAGFVSNFVYNKNNYTVEFYQVSGRKLTHGFRVAFLSDVHLREYGDGNSELVSNVQNLSPDLILLGGDLVTSGINDYDSMITLCEKLSGIAPVYGVLGNHEDVKIYNENDGELLKRFRDAGVSILVNEKAEIELYDNKITILGVDGSPYSFEKYGAGAFMDSWEKISDESDFTVCLAHVPTYFTSRLASYSFDLGLAGHDHGGIVILPGLGPLYSAEEGWFPKYADGEYSLKNGAKLIVSRGLGDSGAAPRINNVPVLVIVDVN